MSDLNQILWLGQYTTLAALAAAVVASVVRRWRLVMTLGRGIIILSVAMILLVVGVSEWGAANAEVHPSMKAAHIAQSISMMLNCCAFFGSTAIAGFLLRLVAQRRLRARSAR